MDIDFVLPWVDGTDELWLKEKNEYYNGEINIDAEIRRYRDWNNLRYWFRGVEKYAPWVNKVYFITWGHVPSWLNIHHSKLVIIYHKDYIPDKYLPTFSSHPIELNLHRIRDLSEHFVYFNDDLFLTSKVEESDFFVNGMPCDLFVEDPVTFKERDVVNSVIVNDLIAINSEFDRNDFLKTKHKKVYKLFDKKGLAKNILLSFFHRQEFIGIEFNHLPQSFLKSSFEQAWAKNGEWLDETCNNKFRSVNDLNQYYIKFCQMLKGNFHPYNWRKVGKAFHLVDLDSKDNNIDEAVNAIKGNKYKYICLNDVHVENFEDTVQRINDAFEIQLSEKCSFEL